MSGGDFQFGDRVSIVGGQGHQGIVHHNHAAPQRTLEEQLREVVQLALALRSDVPDDTDRASIDHALPALADDASAEPPARRRSLMALAAIAATVGAVGEPLLGSVKAALELLGR
ncbi:hypothetical protein AB0G71_22875 [Streptomyces sp. NPDC020403]|uniref:hypothetical protein n=1 Tax=unclassified Streptomyces TaxID=2593676 RepID=UPI0033C64FF0